MVFGRMRPWNWLCTTTLGDYPSRRSPTNSAEEAFFHKTKSTRRCLSISTESFWFKIRLRWVQVFTRDDNSGPTPLPRKPHAPQQGSKTVSVLSAATIAARKGGAFPWVTRSSRGGTVRGGGLAGVSLFRIGPHFTRGKRGVGGGWPNGPNGLDEGRLLFPPLAPRSPPPAPRPPLPAAFRLKGRLRAC